MQNCILKSPLDPRRNTCLVSNYTPRKNIHQVNWCALIDSSKAEVISLIRKTYTLRSFSFTTVLSMIAYIEVQNDSYSVGSFRNTKNYLMVESVKHVMSKPKCSETNVTRGTIEYAYRKCILVSCPTSGDNIPFRPRFDNFLQNQGTHKLGKNIKIHIINQSIGKCCKHNTW